MADEPTRTDDLAEGVVPPLIPPPTITREFKPEAWHRPRKQHLRKHQWNYEIVEQIIKKRPAAAADLALRVFGLPSHEYLDLLSMRDFCEEHKIKVIYLGFNHSFTRATGSGAAAAQPIDLYHELQAQRMIEASTFVHPSSRLVPDFFEQIRLGNSMSRNALKGFGDFDVINLDLCGCIVGNGEQTTHALEAVSELIRWQSTRRLTPWLFFMTTFASPTEINLAGCKLLADAVKENADDSEDFHNELKSRANLDSEALVSCFTTPGAKVPDTPEFIRIFALSLGKWLAARLRQPNPPSFLSMLPSFCFRHKDIDAPQLLSLAYLVKPAPSAGAPGITTTKVERTDHAPEYRKHAKKILIKSFDLLDLDQLMKDDEARRREAADETEELLVNCGFDAAAVRTFLATHR
jgi:hypothetical protein